MLHISKKPRPWLIDVLESVSAIADDQSIPYLVVGAMARDVIFELANGIAAPRRTEDLDLGLRVSSWEEFEHLVDALVATGRFARTRAKQRILFDDAIRLDIVPFGNIATADHIRWPPDFAIEMNVAGFSLALGDAIVVRLRDKPALDIPVASPAGLCFMKVVAWSDRNVSLRDKDATDLAFLLRYYLNVAGKERVANDFPEWLEGDFDYELASAQLLGIDMQRIMGATIELAKTILDDEVGRGIESTLAYEMAGRRVDAQVVERECGLLAALLLGVSG